MKKLLALFLVSFLLASCSSQKAKVANAKEVTKEVKIELNTKEVKVEDLIDTTNKDYTYQIKEAVDTSKEGKQIVTVVKINNKTKEQREEEIKIVIVKSVATNTTVTTTPATNVSTSYEKRSETTTTPTTTKAVVKETTVAKEESKVKIPKTSDVKQSAIVNSNNGGLDTSNWIVQEAQSLVGAEGTCDIVANQLLTKIHGRFYDLKLGNNISQEQAEIGDVIKYDYSEKTGLAHIAIYLGNGKALHGNASNGKAVIGNVKFDEREPYFYKVVDVNKVVEKNAEEITPDQVYNPDEFNPSMCDVDWDSLDTDEKFAPYEKIYTYCVDSGNIKH